MSLNAEQLVNARTIIGVGKNLGASQRDITIALMAALQESNLTNINYGDRAGPDSRGLFQQRAPWGTLAQRMDPAQSAAMFFQGGHGGQRGLFGVRNRDQLALTRAAQAVQVSAYPDAYAKHQSLAESLLGLTPGQAGAISPTTPSPGSRSVVSTTSAKPLTTTASTLTAAATSALDPAAEALPAGLGKVTPAGLTLDTPAGLGGTAAAGITPTDDSPLQPFPIHDQATFNQQYLGPQTSVYAPGGGLAPKHAANAVAIAQSYIGTPFVWGGNSRSGLDCSGLVQTVYRQMGINLPRISSDQARAGQRIAMKDLQPGDLVAWDNSVRNVGADHIAVYVGNNQIVESPRPGLNTRQRTLDSYDANGWGVRLHQNGSTQ